MGVQHGKSNLISTLAENLKYFTESGTVISSGGPFFYGVANGV